VVRERRHDRIHRRVRPHEVRRVVPGLLGVQLRLFLLQIPTWFVILLSV